MKVVFADTSYYVALFNEGDRAHSQALAYANNQELRIVISEFVLLELGGAMYRPGARSGFVQLVERLRSNPRVTIEPAAESLFEKALHLFDTRQDKQWSLIDCSSFVVMNERGIDSALSTDHHFEQAGFTILLK